MQGLSGLVNDCCQESLRELKVISRAEYLAQWPVPRAVGNGN